MKPLSFFNIYIIILLFLSGCTDNKESSDYKPLELDASFLKYKEVSDIKKLFELIDTVKLENSKESIIGYVWDAQKNQDNFIIADPIGVKSVKVYNEDGIFIQNLGRNGQGPEEYNTPDLLAVNDKYIVIYDPSQMKIIIFNNKFEFIKSWKLKYFAEGISISNEDKVIILRKPDSVDGDFKIDLYDIEGNLKKSIVLPESLRKKNRRFLFGKSYRIMVQTDKIFYIGADEFKILCYNLNEERIEWASNKLPDIIKIPDIPTELNSRSRIEWMKENYTPLNGFYIFNNGLQIVHIPGYFLLYDNHGNYLTNVKVDDKEKIYFSKNNNLYAVTFPLKINDNDIINPHIFIYKIKDNL